MSEAHVSDSKETFLQLDNPLPSRLIKIKEITFFG